MTSRKPWAATETEHSQKGRRSTLYTAAEAIRIITALLYPVLPAMTAKVWSQLGLGDIELAAKNGELNHNLSNGVASNPAQNSARSPPSSPAH